MEVKGNFALRPAPKDGADGKSAPTIGLGVTCHSGESGQADQEYIAINEEKQTISPTLYDIFVDDEGEVQTTVANDAPIVFGRGTSLFFINKDTLALKEWHRADTYAYSMLADYLGEVIAQYRTEHPEYIVVLITSDAASCNQYLRSQLTLCGGTAEGTYEQDRRRHYFVGQCSDIEPNQGYEEISVEYTLKKVTVQVNQGVGIVKNGIYGEDAINVVIDGNPLVLDGTATGATNQKYIYIDVWKGDKKLENAKQEFEVSFINETGAKQYLFDGKLWYNFGLNTDGRFYFVFRTSQAVDVDGTLSFTVTVDGKTFPQNIPVRTIKSGSKGYDGAKPYFYKWSDLRKNQDIAFKGVDGEEFYTIVYDDIDNTGWYTPMSTHVVTAEEQLTDASLWRGSNMEFVATSVFFAQMAYVENLGVKNVLLTDDDNNIIGGMCTQDNSGGLSPIGLGDVKFWLGSDKPHSAPARIYDDGSVNFSKGTFGGTLSVARIIKRTGTYNYDESTQRNILDLNSSDTFRLQSAKTYTLPSPIDLDVGGTTVQIIAEPLSTTLRARPTLLGRYYIVGTNNSAYEIETMFAIDFGTSIMLFASPLGWVIVSIVGAIEFKMGSTNMRMESAIPTVIN